MGLAAGRFRKAVPAEAALLFLAWRAGAAVDRVWQEARGTMAEE